MTHKARVVIGFSTAVRARNSAIAFRSAGVKARAVGKSVRVYSKIVSGGVGSKRTFRMPVRGTR